ncbi:MAG: sulfatase family protein [Solirubrobacteraceae bacterium]
MSFGHARRSGPGAIGRWVRPAAAVVLLAVIAAVVLLSGIAAGGSRTGAPIGDGHQSPVGGSGQPVAQPPVPPLRGRRRPNIVFVLTDDLSSDLVAFMPHVQSMERSGLTFTNYFVSDSLCCPSRASIFTGNFPHDTHVFSNVGRNGGFHIFHRRGEEHHTFAVALRRAGYRTAMMGKYLNGYLEGPGSDPRVRPTYVPPGWSTWDVAGDGYPEFNYTMNENGHLHHYGHAAADYLTDVIARKGRRFIDRSAASGHPFFLELATFAPHRPYTPAPRDRQDFPYLQAPRPPSFNRVPTHAPIWLGWRPPLDSEQIAQIDQDYRLRADSVQSVDDMLGSIEQTLAADGLTRDTYVIFSSDNGLHMGQYRLAPGKLTAFDTDIHVPLVVVGPGVPTDARTPKVSENIDLAPTFAALGRTSLRADGHSLAGLLHGERAPRWPDAALVEHRGPLRVPGDPDFQGPGSGNPPSYEAMRTPRFLYVEYRDGEREYYDLKRDPYELHNIAGRLHRRRLAQLHRALVAIEHCHGGRACWAALHVGGHRQHRR